MKKMSVKVAISVKNKRIKLPTGTRLLIRKACNATLNYEGLEENFFEYFGINIPLEAVPIIFARLGEKKRNEILRFYNCFCIFFQFCSGF